MIPTIFANVGFGPGGFCGLVLVFILAYLFRRDEKPKSYNRKREPLTNWENEPSDVELRLKALGNQYQRDQQKTNKMAKAPKPETAEEPPPVPTVRYTISYEGEWKHLTISEICALINLGALSLDDCYFDRLKDSWIALRLHPQISQT